MMAPDPTTKFGDKRKACGASQETNGLYGAAIVFLVTVQIQTNPINVWISLHTGEVQRRTVLVGHIVEDRHVLNTALPEHAGDTRHTPADLVFFISNPVQVPGKIVSAVNSAVARRLNGREISILVAICPVECL